MIILWDTKDEFYDDLDEAWSWYSPASGYEFIKEPTIENAAKALWVPTLSLGTFMAFNYAMLGYGGMPHFSFWSASVWGSRLSAYRWLSSAAMPLARFSSRFAPEAALVLTEVYMAHELYGTMTKNMSMESVEGVPGAMTHPFEGSSDREIYYPGKSLVDWVSSW